MNYSVKSIYEVKHLIYLYLLVLYYKSKQNQCDSEKISVKGAERPNQCYNDAFGRRTGRVEYKEYGRSHNHEWKKETNQSYLYEGLSFNVLAEMKDLEYNHPNKYEWGWWKHNHYQGKYRPMSEYTYGNGRIISRTDFNEYEPYSYGRGSSRYGYSKSNNYGYGYSYGNYKWRNKEYYSQDILGSTMLLTDERGNTKEKYIYDAFGNAYEGNFLRVNEIGYNGKRLDSAVNLYDYGFRDYMPMLGIWSTVDPIRDGNNWYAYCVNDPVNYVDLLGLYDRDNAVDYALYWSGNNLFIFERRNPEFKSFEENCANFVSQSLHAGGIKMTDEWYMKMNGETLIDKSPTWSSPDYLKDYLQSEGISKSSNEIKISSSEIVSKALEYKDDNGNQLVKIGDVVLFDFNSDKEMDHSAIITKIKDGDIFYSSNTNNVTNKSLTKALKEADKITEGKTDVYILPIEDCAK